MKALVLYYSKTGNTEKMANMIKKELSKSVECDIKTAVEIEVDQLLNYDAIIIGSPTYYGSMAAEIKKVFDASVKLHGKLDGKIGAAFSSAANIAGGNETTVLDIINAMLVHGMVVQGDPQGDHYGLVSIGAPDDRVEKNCIKFADRISGLMQRLS
jgi:NAD(P)H dehydrogenase (quinone)